MRLFCDLFMISFRFHIFYVCLIINVEINITGRLIGIFFQILNWFVLEKLLILCFLKVYFKHCRLELYLHIINLWEESLGKLS